MGFGLSRLGERNMGADARILVVDDDPYLLRATSRLLKQAGYEVVEAETGQEGLRLAQEQRPELILLDVVLPDVTGFEVCRRIKEDLVETDCFVVMVSGAKTSPSEQANGLEVGADGYITRPVANQELLARVAALLRIKRAEEKVAHLNCVLRAINNVNQFIAREKDRARMLQGICDLLVEPQGYHNAWIAIFDESSGVEMTTEAGLGVDFNPLLEQLKRGELTACGQQALAQAGVVVIEAPAITCTDCPLAANYAGRGAMTIRLEYDSVIYGLLTVSIPAHRVATPEEQTLLQEVAGNIAFVLQAIEWEEERRRAEKALCESEHKFRMVIEQSLDSIVMCDEAGLIIEWNRAQEQLSGIRRSEALRRPLWDLLVQMAPEEARSPAVCEEVRKAVRKMLQTGENPGFEQRREQGIVRPDGTRRIVETALFPIRTEAGFMIGGITRDVTERKRAEEALWESEHRLDRMLQTLVDGMVRVNLDGEITYANPAAERILEVHRGEIHGRYYNEREWQQIDEDGYPFPLDRLPLAFALEQKQEVEGLEHGIEAPNGERKWLSVNAAPLLDENGQLYGAIASFRDVTEQKEAQRQVKTALWEKEVLLKEIHHRVKNNLSIVAGLLDFQATKVEDEQAREAFQESQNRIYTMAHIHEHLYRSQDLAHVDMADYLHNLMSHLGQSYGAYGIEMDVRADDVALPADTAIPCGLIVNELVSNALEHAFPPRRREPGQDRVSVEMYEDNRQWVLKIGDNGIGLPADFEWHDLSSLGIKLTDMLVKQLGGDLVWHTEGGTTFSITFPSSNAKE